jgi:ATP-dependent RNA helicase DHX37/DHR1
MLLPVCAEEQVIMETVEQNDVCIICGETGSGKTTQVPQFLYEAGYASDAHPGLIGVTQPRRVAAVSMAKRVAVELNCKNDSEVCYQIRYDSRVGEDTKVKFMTDGILLKEIQQDFLLRKYSVLILDEAHERNLNTDVLIGLLSRILPLRNQLARQQNDANSVDIQNVMSAVNATEAQAAVTAASTSAKLKSKIRLTPLKLIIMSATLRVSDFVDNKRLFAVPPPVVHIAARQYPVTIHFNKRTPIDDYLPEALKKIIKIHRKLPPGGILVFLTGRREIEDVCSKLRKKFGKLGTLVDPRAPVTASTNAASAPRKPMSKVEKLLDTEEPETESAAKVESKLDELDAFGGGADATEDAEAAQFDIDASTRASEADEQLSSDDEDLDHDEEEEEEDEFPDLTENETTMRVRVLPLYSLLGTQQQMQVFDSVDAAKERLVVVATNVAETSLTIPGIKYVVDAGREKSRTFDRMSGSFWLLLLHRFVYDI